MKKEWKKGDFIPFSPPRVDDLIINEVIDTLRSGWWTTGKKTLLFEKKIAEYCGVKGVKAVGSATEGLELVLRWFGIDKDDEVIVPTYTFCATANVVLHCGAKVVFADVNYDDMNISLKEIEKKITSNTKVIIPVDVGGLPCNYDEIYQIIFEKKHLFKPKNEVQEKLGRILILSDSAHSFGAIYKGKKSGTLSDISVFSFHTVKNLPTGEGGAIAFNLPEEFDINTLYKEFSLLSLHGQDKDAISKFQNNQWEYDIIVPGYKCNLTDIQSSIGLVEINRYDSETLPKRKKIFDIYTNAFKNYHWAELPIYQDSNRISSFHLYCLKIKNINEQIRNKIIDDILKNNVSVNVHFKPIPLFTAYKKLGYNINDYPNSYLAYSREITLPVYFDLTEEMQEQVIEVITKAVEKNLI